MKGHILVGLDGCLAEATGRNGRIGAPLPRMVARVKEWVAAGDDVWIFTERVSGLDQGYDGQRALIERWCRVHIGRVLPITCRLNYGAAEIWDARAVGVGTDGGRADEAECVFGELCGRYVCATGGEE